MKTAAIICEYDPFHNGHAYLIRKARTELGFERIVCIMSGNYVQRGAPAVCDKYLRAKWALKGGADLVLEIPPLFSTSAAPEFAASAIRIAEASGIIDALVFGVEEGITFSALKKEASRDISAVSSGIRECMRSGLTYPEALSASDGSFDHLSANNILAAEYLRAIENAGSSIVPVPVERIGDGFSARLPENSSFTSATALRSLLERHETVEPYVPSYVLEDRYVPVMPDAMTLYLSKALLTEPDLTVFHDVSREIAGRLAGRKNRIMSFSERVADTKTRQYTYARISRALLHIALGMRKEDFVKAKENNYISCLRILGLRKNSPLPSCMKEKAVLPIAGRTAQYEDLLGKDILYDQLYYSLTGSRGEYDRSPVILDGNDI